MLYTYRSEKESIMTTPADETLLDVFINDKGELCKKVKVGDKITFVPLTKYSATATPSDTPTDFNERFKDTETFPNDFKALATKVLEKKMHTITSGTVEWNQEMIDKVLHIHAIMGIVVGFPSDILEGKCDDNRIQRLKSNTALSEFFGMLCKAMGDPWDKVAEKYRL
jgi:hypothetical protein